MGSKRFDSIADFWRHGYNMHLECADPHCRHTGVVDPYSAWHWWKLHRWPDAIEGGALRHFRCTRCKASAGRARPTEQAVTVVNFFPSDERGWSRLAARLRG